MTYTSCGNRSETNKETLVPMREYQFDGLVGPTHNYGGLSPGNVASTTHAGQVSNPRAAAMQGLQKMRFVRDLGVPQAVLPPHDRPSLASLRRLGFHGSDEEVIAGAAAGDGFFLRVCSSASAMWVASRRMSARAAESLTGMALPAMKNSSLPAFGWGKL